MKKFVFIFAILGSFAFTILGPITEKERTDLLNYYNLSDSILNNEIKGLSDAQLNWKPNDSTWSVANCLEHITLAENGIFQWFQQTVTAPADSSKKAEVKVTDDQVKQMVESRDQKAKAPEQLRPTNHFSNAKNTLDSFNVNHNNIESYIKSTQDDLRGHYAQTPVGTIDTYQMLVFLNAHTRRHTAQIVALKAMPGFPKK